MFAKKIRQLSTILIVIDYFYNTMQAMPSRGMHGMKLYNFPQNLFLCNNDISNQFVIHSLPAMRMQLSFNMKRLE